MTSQALETFEAFFGTANPFATVTAGVNELFDAAEEDRRVKVMILRSRTRSLLLDVATALPNENSCGWMGELVGWWVGGLVKVACLGCMGGLAGG